MEAKHGAIETEYAGHLFRSRLEARWAVFFDELKIEWKYESQGFEADGYRYLPDFYLPAKNVWVEVKGDPSALSKDLPRMRVMLGAASPLPGVPEGKAGLLLLGEVPNSATLVMHPILCRDSRVDAIRREAAIFLPPDSQHERGRLVVADSPSWCRINLFKDLDTNDSSEAWDCSAMLPCVPHNICAGAYQAARFARFEHGQSGAVTRTNKWISRLAETAATGGRR